MEDVGMTLGEEMRCLDLTAAVLLLGELALDESDGLAGGLGALRGRRRGAGRDGRPCSAAVLLLLLLLLMLLLLMLRTLPERDEVVLGRPLVARRGLRAVMRCSC